MRSSLARHEWKNATARVRSLIANCRSDLSYSLRGLVRTPTFSIGVIVVLALGIGVNVGLLALLNRVIFAGPSGVPEPNRITRLYFASSSDPRLQLAVTADAADQAAIQAALGGNAQVAMFMSAIGARIGRGETTTANLTFARAEYFDVLRVRPQQGRFFLPGEVSPPGTARPAILSDRLWHRLGSDTTMIGQEIAINGAPYRVIGIAPPGFGGVDLFASDLWLLLSPNKRPVQILVRRRDGAEPPSVASVVATVLRRSAGNEEDSGRRVTVAEGPLNYTRTSEHRPKQINTAIGLALLALTVLVLAATNISNLLLARGLNRRREFAVRVALGASHSRVLGLILIEPILLAVIASMLSATLAYAVNDLVRSQLMSQWRLGPPQWDSSVTWITFLLCGSVVLLCTLAPAWKLSHLAMTDELRVSLADRHYRRSKLRTSLVVAQSALSFALLVVAGVFVASLRNVLMIDIGYDADRLTVGTVAFGTSLPGAPQVISRVATQINERPDVEAVALATRAPLQGVSFADSLFIADREPISKLASGQASWIGVSPAFFSTVGLRIVRGRGVEDGDAGEYSVVVNEEMAAQLWPTMDAIGQCIRLARIGPCYRVVGIVENAPRLELIEPPTPIFYVPLSVVPYPDWPPRVVIVRARASGNSSAIRQALRHEIQNAFPATDFLIQNFGEFVSYQERPWRLSAALTALFAGIALLIAVSGVFATVSYSIAQRTREMGVRLALGARSRDLMVLVLREELRPVVLGLALGIALSLWTGRFVSAFVYGISPYDWSVFASMFVVLALAAVMASTVPALRIRRLEPTMVMRAE